MIKTLREPYDLLDLDDRLVRALPSGSVKVADAVQPKSTELGPSASANSPLAASLIVGRPFQADTSADVRNELRAPLNGAKEANSSCEKQLAARVRLESLTYTVRHGHRRVVWTLVHTNRCPCG